MRKKLGFTLVEILVALAILSGAMLIVSKIWSGNRVRIDKINIYDKVSALMEQKIAELEFEWSRISFDSIPREVKGDFEREKHFSWSAKTKALELPNPQVLLNLMGQTEGTALQVATMTSQFLSQSILEIQLTIHYKKGRLKSAYSISSYIVDHTKQISLPSN